MVTPISKARNTTGQPPVAANHKLSNTSRVVLRLNLELQRQITTFNRNTRRTSQQPALTLSQNSSTNSTSSFFTLNTLVRNRPEAATTLLQLLPHELAKENHGLAKLCKAFITKDASDLPTATELTDDLANLCAVDSIPDKSLVTDLLHKLISGFIEPARMATESGKTISSQQLFRIASLVTVLLKAQGKISDNAVTTIGKLETAQLDKIIGACDLALQTANPNEARNAIEATRDILERKRNAIELVRAYPLELEHMDEVTRADRDVVIRAVQIMGWALSFASDALKNDRHVVHAAVRQNGWALGFAGESMRADKRVVMSAVQNNGIAYQFASRELQKDREVAIAAIRNSQVSIIHMSPQFQRDPELRAIAFPRHGQH
jgi:hypothetical protein